MKTQTNLSFSKTICLHVFNIIDYYTMEKALYYDITNWTEGIGLLQDDYLIGVRISHPRNAKNIQKKSRSRRDI